MNLTQTTGPTLRELKKPKGRKNSTFLEAWEKETSNTITLKKKKKGKEKSEKYYINKGTN